MREKGGFVAVLAALTAAAFHVGSTSVARPPSQDHAARAPGSVGKAESALLGVFGKFAKADQYHSPFDQTGACLAQPALSQPAGTKFSWVIATVPDPEHSRAKLDFDRELEAIQTAAQRAHYGFERYWFPWNNDENSAPDTTYVLGSGSSNATDSDKVLLSSAKDDRRERLPGVLLFRTRSEDQSKSSDGLAIFLVSETPVAGIDPDQFRSAICYGRSLHPADNFDPHQLRVIGPGFSGSLMGLPKLLTDSSACAGDGRQLGCFDRIVLRSWTADFVSHEGLESFSLGPNKDRKALIDFRTTAVPSVFSINCFVHMLRAQWNDASPVVLMVEGGTTLGNGIRIGSQRHSESGCEASAKNFREITQPLVYTLNFPRNISNLRNATENESQLPGFANAKPEVPHTGLTFSLKADDNASIDIPFYSKQQTPISQESSLFSLSNMLKSGIVHYVGIVASDPLDMLFLTRYLHSACPNLRIFSLNSDLLLEHGADSADYEGTLAVTSSPLIPIAQLWSGSTTALSAFASSAAEETYNAASIVLSSLQKQPVAPDLRDFGNPFGPEERSTSPSLWLTVAGSSGYQPLQLLTTNASRFNFVFDHGSQRRLVPQYWPGWGYLFYLLLCACLVYAFLLVWTKPEGNRTLALFSAKPLEPNPMPRAFYLSALGCVLGTALVLWMFVPGVIVADQFAFGVAATSNALASFALRSILLFGLGAAAMAVVWLASAGRRLPNTSADPKARNVPGPLQKFRSATASSTVALLAISTLAVSQVPISTSPAVERLSTFFAFACVTLGVSIVAAVLPICDALSLGVKDGWYKSDAQKLRFWRMPYFWAAAGLNLFFAIIAALVAFAIFSNSFGPSAFFAACRELNLAGGVSPLLPLSLMLVGLGSLAVAQLRRITTFEDRCPKLPDLPNDFFCPSLSRTADDIKCRIRNLSIHPVHGVAFIFFAAILLLVFADHGQQTFENGLLENLVLGLAVASCIFLILVWLRLILIWSAFNEFLQQMERHPLRIVFSLLPRGFVWSPVWQGGSKRRTHVAITRSLECILALENHAETPAPLRDLIRDKIDTLKLQIRQLLERSASRLRVPPAEFQKVEQSLSEVANAAVDQLELQTWPKGGYELKAELFARAENRDAVRVDLKEFREQEPAAISGELVAFRFLAFINFVLGQLDNLVGYLSFGFLMLAVSLNSYPFRSRTIIDWLLVALFAVITTGIIMVFSQADRDAILSRITGTEEGKLDRHFFSHLISYGAMPGLVLASTHFPVLGKFFFSWIKPAMEAIH